MNSYKKQPVVVMMDHWGLVDNFLTFFKFFYDLNSLLLFRVSSLATITYNCVGFGVVLKKIVC